MSNIGHLVQTLVSFLFVLGVLVSIHELGHYLAARWCRVGVEAFSLGFGPALKSWVDRRGTVWKISALPLGGYVKMYGMTPLTPAEQVESGEAFRPQDAYCAKPVYQRAFIAFAGPLANFVLAMVLFSALLITIGRQVQLPVVGEVVANSAAAQAGLLPGDDIRAVDGVPIATFTALRQIVLANPDHDIGLTVHRGAADMQVRVHVQAHGSTGQLGVTSGRTAIERVGPGAALVGGVTDTWDMLSATVSGLAGIIANGRGADELGGPIMIAQLSGKVAQLGIANLIMFIAVLSVNLGMVNLLPIPVLDGGHLMFYAAEALRGRPVPARAQEYGYRVGIAIIACVFVMVSWNDLVKDGAIHWVTHLAG
jgi:regulator of sigma E protease